MQWIGSREVAFILAQAPELPAPPNNWEAQARTKIFYDPVSGGDFRSYVRTVSYGQARLTGDIYGPFQVTAKRPNGSWDLGGALGQAVAAASNSGLVAGITYFCAIFTNYPVPSWAFWSGSGGSCYVDMVDPLGVIAMENTHMITQFSDLYGVADSPGGYDNMACACGTHPSAYTKIQFGWIPPNEVATVPSGISSSTLTLHALSSPIAQAPTPGRFHAVAAPSPMAKQYYLAEARLRLDKYESQTQGVSDGIPAEGVVVYWIDESVWPPVHIRKVLSTPGEAFADAARAFTITLTSQVPMGFTVEVQRGEPAECAQIRDEVASIHADIEGLQADLKVAAPGEKPGIAGQIKRLLTQQQSLRNRGSQLGCRP